MVNINLSVINTYKPFRVILAIRQHAEKIFSRSICSFKSIKSKYVPFCFWINQIRMLGTMFLFIWRAKLNVPILGDFSVFLFNPRSTGWFSFPWLSIIDVKADELCWKGSSYKKKSVDWQSTIKFKLWLIQVQAHGMHCCIANIKKLLYIQLQK